MNPSELLKDSKSANVVFHQFVLLHRKYKTDLFCFYEGKDTQYYFPRINLVEENHHILVCGNKKSVLDAHKLIKMRYSEFRTKFFIDSDFDVNEELIDVYITPSYSIENLYCTDKVFSNILKNEFLLNSEDEEYKILMRLYTQRQKEFHKGIRLFNLWYFVLKRILAKKKSLPDISLGSKVPKEFISFSLTNISANYNLEKIKERFPSTIEINQQDLQEYEV